MNPRAVTPYEAPPAVAIRPCKACGHEYPSFTIRKETVCPDCRSEHYRNQNVLMKAMLKQAGIALSAMPNYQKLARMISDFLR